MEKLDLKDRRLIYLLDCNSRTSNRQLGKKIGLTEQAIGYKIKRLLEKGVIKKFITFVNALSLGYTHYKVFVKIQDATEEVEKKIMDYLVKNKNVRWIVSTSGKYDLSFSVLAKTPQEFSSIYQEIESRFGKFISEKNIFINVSSPGFTRDYLINRKQSTKVEYSRGKEMRKLDDTDKSVLKSLSQNSRKNIVDISEEIKSTVDVVKYRIKKMISDRIISSFTVQLDLEKMGYEYYSIFFSMHNLNEILIKNILDFAINHPGILFVVQLIGNYDIQLEIEVKNYQELEQILKKFRFQFSKNIRDFEILRVNKEFKYDFFPF